MKKVILLLLSFICCTNIFASSPNQIIFLGDSLSDNGNLYKLFLHLIPKSPPYYQGRFSNGPTWAEGVGKYYYDKYYIDYKNYALGGATAILHKPTTKFIAPTNLELEVDQYLIEYLFKDKSNTLFSIWIGNNDYLFDQDGDANVLSQQVVNKIGWAMKTLIKHGAKEFLVFNLPDLSQIPFAKTHDSTKLQLLVTLHNQKLDDLMKQFKANYPKINIHFIDIYSLFTDVIANPEKYNEKYHLNIKNTHDACWQGGYFFKNSSLTSQINNDLLKITSSKNNNLDTESISNLISETPALSYVYTMGQFYERGILPCHNADEYLFWDDMHPTQIVHKILSQIVIQNLGEG